MKSFLGKILVFEINIKKNRCFLQITDPTDHKIIFSRNEFRSKIICSSMYI